MPVWGTRSVSDEPTIPFVRWRLFRVLDKPDNQRFGLHLCGYNVAGREGRVSSRIMEIDHDRRTVKTRSGRTYELQGDSGVDADAFYVLGVWLTAHDIAEFEFLTELPELGSCG